MFALFKTHIEKFVSMSDEEFNQIISFFELKSFARKENLLEQDQICRYHYFVLNGLLRKFYINEKGGEQTTEFALENWWLTDNMAFECQRPTPFYIQAVEKTEVLQITKAEQERLLNMFPKMERYFRFVYQRAYAASQMRVKYLFGLSKEAFYHDFSRKYPDFVQRVPQYLIASFLGFTPEYLSEIRRRTIS